MFRFGLEWVTNLISALGELQVLNFLKDFIQIGYLSHIYTQDNQHIIQLTLIKEQNPQQDDRACTLLRTFQEIFFCLNRD